VVWCGAVAFDGSGTGTVVTDDATQVLHHRERERRVRWDQGGQKRRGLAANRADDRRPRLGEIWGGERRSWHLRPVDRVKRGRGRQRA
jgi:hypothetical protein